MRSGTRSKRAEKAGGIRRSVRIHRPLRTVAPRSRTPRSTTEALCRSAARSCGESGGRGGHGRERRRVCPGSLRRSSTTSIATTRVATTRIVTTTARDDGDGGYDYARSSTCSRWSRESASARRSANAGTRPAIDERGYGNGPLPRSSAGGAVLGAVIGARARPPDRSRPRPRCGHRGGRRRRRGRRLASRPSAAAVRRGCRRASTRCSVARRVTTRVARAHRRLPRDVRVQRPPPGDRAAVPPRRPHPRAGRREPGGVDERVVCHGGVGGAI